LRIIVCVTFVCCFPRRDFDPQGVVTASRFYPLFHILTNQELGALDARITVQRPDRVMEMPDMTTQVSAALFADRNADSRLSPIPAWDRIFDYYDTSPRAGISFIAVKADGANARPRHQSSLRRRILPTGSPGVFSREETEVRKVARQAEFDNLHLAPRMLYRAPKYPHAEIGDAVEVTMAPVCQHDCLHTHWRWGEGYDQLHALGWSDNEPYSVAGAPLVPKNQEIRMTLLPGSPGFHYDATLRPVEAGKMHVVYHHGSAYAVGLGVVVDWLTDNAIAWPRFYYMLRYLDPAQTGADGVERIVFDLDALRRL
jgi:hypothetical protein